MIISIITAIISGVAMSIQGIFNTSLNKKIGILETIVLIQGIGFVASLIMSFFFRSGSYSNLKSVNKLYLTGGLLGIVISYTVIQSISSLGPALATSIILVSQILAASIINAIGLFDSEKIHFTLNNFIGIALMIIGIIIFQWRK